MSLIDEFLRILHLDGVRMRQPQPLEDDAATAFQAALVSENRILRAELKRNGYSDFYIDHLIRSGGKRT
jgi:hypothetical protein